MKRPAGTLRPPHATVGAALRTLQLSERRWQAFLEASPDAILTIDRQGRIILFNAAAERIFGYRAADVLRRNVSMLMPAPYRDEHDQYVHRYLGGALPRAIGRVRELQGLRQNGDVFPMELSVSEARVGRQVTFTAIVRDLSDRVRIEAELRQTRLLAQQRERLADVGAITAKIVHDLGNPVAALSMQAQLILRRAHRGAPIQTVRVPAERILAATERLDNLIREFMDFTREQRLDLRTVRLPDFLAEVVNLWQPVAAERQIDLTLDTPAEVPSITADVDKLRRVFDNLVKNAVEAVDSGPGRVRISVGAPLPARVLISVEDSGPGIANDLQVFRLFETTKAGGSGLGLAVARQIVLAHGGGITFASVLPHGTVFHVELPEQGPTQ